MVGEAMAVGEMAAIDPAAAGVIRTPAVLPLKLVPAQPAGRATRALAAITHVCPPFVPFALAPHRAI